MTATTAGGDTRRFRSSITRNRRNCTSTFWGLRKNWVSAPFGADGWRLDVAADLGRSAWMNHQFWRDFRAAVKEANPEAVMIAEHYGSPYDWLKGDQWDTVMNYDAFMEPLSWFLTGMEKHSDEENPALFGDGCAFF